MDKSTEEIVNKLKLYKQQGRSYYQATQQLLKSGYTQTQIDDAEDVFNYSQPTVNTSGNQYVTNDQPAMTDNIDDNDPYTKVGEALIKDTKKKKIPAALTWDFTYSHPWYGLISGRVWLAFIIGLIGPFYFESHYPQYINNTQYCNSIFVSDSSQNSPNDCLPAKAIVYGWPIRGQVENYDVQGKGLFYGNFNRSIFAINTLLFIVAAYLGLFLIDEVRSRL